MENTPIEPTNIQPQPMQQVEPVKPTHDDIINNPTKGVNVDNIEQDLLNQMSNLPPEQGKQEIIKQEDGTFTDKDGYVVNEKGEHLDEEGNVVEPEETVIYKHENGKFYDEEGNEVDEEGTPIEDNRDIFTKNLAGVKDPIIDDDPLKSEEIDKQIINKIYLSDKWSGFRQICEKNEIDFDDKFALEMEKRGITPTQLTEQEIYNFGDLVDSQAYYKSAFDKDKVYLPDEDSTPEEKAKFEEQWLGIPQDPTDFDENIFESEYINMEQEESELRDFGYESGLSDSQLANTIEYIANREKEIVETKAEEFEKFKEIEKERLEKIYSDKVDSVLKSVYTSMLDYDESFYDRYKDSEIFRDADFIRFVYGKSNANELASGAVKTSTLQTLRSLPVDRLEDIARGYKSNMYYSDSYSHSEDPEILKLHKGLKKGITLVDKVIKEKSKI